MPEHNEHFLDFSQYKQFQFCELAWYEKYVAQCARQRPARQADDPMTLGSLVHSALEQYRTSGAIGHIPEAVVVRHQPTPECLAWARVVATGYCTTYPNEQFARYHCEEPLRFPLIKHEPLRECGECSRGVPGAYDGLAKIDSYFHTPETVEIASGLADEQFTLEPGYWIHEYKTKAADKDRGDYFNWWRVCMQADFQLHALRAHVGEMPRGIFINVIEKPKEYKPRHTCKSCKVQNERTYWQPSAEGFACPACGNVQVLDLSDKSKKARIPVYYRMKVTRTPEQLATSFEEMQRVAERMQEIRGGDTLLMRATERCVAATFGGPCEYFEPHVLGQEATGFQGFVPFDAFGYIKQ